MNGIGGRVKTVAEPRVLKHELPTTRCGYCNDRFPMVLGLEHWTSGFCNLRRLWQR